MPKLFQNKKEEIKKKKDGIKPTKSSLRNSVLADIREKKLSPRPRWQYILLYAGLWASGIFTLILGSLACAFMMLEFSLPERAYLRWIESNVWLLLLPYWWGIGMIIALTIGYFVFSKTGRSYRYHASVLIGILILWSIIGWSILFMTRLAHWSDQQIRRFEPRYSEMRRGFERIVPRPEEGMLPLKVLELDGDIIRWKNPRGQYWSVRIICQDDICLENKKILRPGKPTLFEGKIVSDGVFESNNILPPPWFHPKNPRSMQKYIRGNTSDKKAE